MISSSFTNPLHFSKQAKYVFNLWLIGYAYFLLVNIVLSVIPESKNITASKSDSSYRVLFKITHKITR